MSLGQSGLELWLPFKRGCSALLVVRLDLMGLTAGVRIGPPGSRAVYTAEIRGPIWWVPRKHEISGFKRVGWLFFACSWPAGKQDTDQAGLA